MPAQPVSFLIGDDFLLPVNYGSHSDYQNFIVENLRKHYPDPDAIPRSTLDIIDRFWNLDLSYTDERMISKYSIFSPKTRAIMKECLELSDETISKLVVVDNFFNGIPTEIQTMLKPA